MKIRNFLFHRVSDEADQLWPPMKPKLFEEIITFLKKNFLIVKLEDFLHSPDSFKNPKVKIATICFDDGYKDNIEYAAPILKTHACPASFYIVTDCIDRNIPTWTYIFDYLFQQTLRLTLELPLQIIPPGRKVNRFSSDQERISFGRWLKPFMKTIGNKERLDIFHMVQKEFNDVELPQNKMMDWHDVKELSNAGFAIGSHSWTHPLLASIENQDELVTELKNSASSIQQHLNFFPATISYPVGSFSKEVMRAAESVGYKYGLAVLQKFYDTERDSPMAIPRVELYNESFFKARLRISGTISKLKSIGYDS